MGKAEICSLRIVLWPCLLSCEGCGRAIDVDLVSSDAASSTFEGGALMGVWYLDLCREAPFLAEGRPRQNELVKDAF